jgi:hypothetical protein
MIDTGSYRYHFYILINGINKETQPYGAGFYFVNLTGLNLTNQSYGIAEKF